MHIRSYIHGHKNHPHFISDRGLQTLKNRFGTPNGSREVILILKNLSQPSKFKIFLLLLKVKEIAVSDIAYVLGLSQSAVSHALSDLKKLGMVDNRRCGQLMCYFLKKRSLKLIKWMNWK